MECYVGERGTCISSHDGITGMGITLLPYTTRKQVKIYETIIFRPVKPKTGNLKRLALVEMTTEDGAAQKALEICKRVPSDFWPSTDLCIIHEWKLWGWRERPLGSSRWNNSWCSPRLGIVCTHTNQSANSSVRMEIPPIAQGLGRPQKGTTLVMEINLA